MIVEQKSNRIASDCTWQRNTDHTLLPIVQQTNEQNGVRHKHKWLLHHNEISNAFNMHWWHIFFRINFGVSTPRKLGVWRVWFHHCMETVCNEDVVEWPGPRELWVPRFKFWVGLILTFSKESGQPFQCSKHSCKAKKLSHSGADQWDQDCPSIVPSCFGYHQLIWLMLPVLWQKVQCPCLCLFCACFTEMWGFLLMWPVLFFSEQSNPWNCWATFQPLPRIQTHNLQFSLSLLSCSDLKLQHMLPPCDTMEKPLHWSADPLDPMLLCWKRVMPFVCECMSKRCWRTIGLFCELFAHHT